MYKNEQNLLPLSLGYISSKQKRTKALNDAIYATSITQNDLSNSLKKSSTVPEPNLPRLPTYRLHP